MFGFRPKLPVTEEERSWVDKGFSRLKSMLGAKRILGCTVIEPTDRFFPDPWDGSEAGLEGIFSRVCGYMHVERSSVDLEIIPDSSELMEALPEYHLRSNHPAGLHFGQSEDEKPLIGIRQSLLKDPATAVATVAHELGHVILLDGGHLSRDVEEMEPMTDLVTVYLGLGIFTANACCRFTKFRDERREGWSFSRHGYLPEEVYGYALAVFAKERGENTPSWASHLSTNVRTYFRKSAAWLENLPNQPAQQAFM
jgi:hypothetical protein